MREQQAVVHDVIRDMQEYIEHNKPETYTLSVDVKDIDVLAFLEEIWNHKPCVKIGVPIFEGVEVYDERSMRISFSKGFYNEGIEKLGVNG